MIQVGVAHATPTEQIWREIEVPEGTTVRDAIEASGILNEFPAIDLNVNNVGIFGKITALDATVEDGDRVEIYRPITVEPEKLERKKYKLRPAVPVIQRPDGELKVLKD